MNLNRYLPLLLVAALANAQSGVGPTPSIPADPVWASTDPFWPADAVFPVQGTTSSWNGFRAKNVQRRTLFAEHKSQDQRSIVFVGDSITEGWETLSKDFADLGVKVSNRGIGGDTTPNLIYRFEEDVLSLKPRALVILIGTNDLGEHTATAQIEDNLRVLLTRIRDAEPNLPIAWCLVMPRRGDDSYPERISDLNSRIRSLVQNDVNIQICDTFTPLSLPNGSSNPDHYVPDRLHLNPSGYRTWLTAIRPIIAGWRAKL